MTTPLPGSLTIEDLFELPDDGNRHELFDGSLLVSPAPDPDHAETTDLLGDLLKAVMPPHLRTWTTAAGVEVKARTSMFIPDLLVVRRHGRRPGLALSPADVFLVVEVLSPSTRLRDLHLKRHGYAEAGIPDYWIVDRKRRRLTVLHLDPGQSEYITAAVVEAGTTYRTDRRFELALDPADFCVATW